MELNVQFRLPMLFFAWRLMLVLSIYPRYLPFSICV